MPSFLLKCAIIHGDGFTPQTIKIEVILRQFKKKKNSKHLNQLKND